MNTWIGVAAAVLIVIAAVSIPLLIYTNAERLVARFRRQ